MYINHGYFQPQISPQILHTTIACHRNVLFKIEKKIQIKYKYKKVTFPSHFNLINNKCHQQ